MKVLNFGSCNIDYVYLLDHIVAPGETEAAEKLSVYCGGKGLNQSIALARAGIRPYHAGCIGEDGDFLVDMLEENNVDISYVKRVQGKNGHAIIQVSATGENSIFIHHGSNHKVTKENIDDTLSHFNKGDIVLLQNEISNLEYIVSQSYKKGLCVIFNPSPINDVVQKIDLQKISYLLLNEIEAKMITGCEDSTSALEYFRQKYPSLAVVLTLGSRGSVYQDAKEQFYQPIFEIEVKDTTAAGDTFTGYFVAELVKGTPKKTALKLASCAAAIAVSRPGAAPSVPIHEETLSALKILKEKNTNPNNNLLKVTIEKYIDENLASASLQGIAQKLGYTTVYTGVLFKKLIGKPYKEYLLERRIRRAAEFLENTDMSIGEISAEIGYENESYFRKKFIETYGKKPLEYRKSFRT